MDDRSTPVTSDAIYPLAVPYFDAKGFRTQIEDGYLEEAIGVDGRFLGAVRNFPGFTRVRKLTTRYGDTLRNANWLYSFSLPIGVTPYSLNGYIVRHSSGGTGFLTAHVYNTQTAAWSIYTIANGCPATGRIDASSYKDAVVVVCVPEAGGSGTTRGYLWYPAATSIGRLYEYSVPEWGTPPYKPDLDAASDAETGGYMRYGTYQVAVRYWNASETSKDRTPLSPPLTVEVPLVTSMNAVRGVKCNAAETSNATFADCSVEIFRTISANVAESTYSAGVFYRETVVPYSQWIAGTPVVLGAMPDAVLVQRELYDPQQDESYNPPNGSKCIHIFQGIAFVDAEGGRSLRWSNTRTSAFRSFHPDQEYVLPSEAGVILRILDASDIVYVFAERGIFKASILGTRVTVEKIHSTWGLTSPEALTQIGKNILFMSQQGLCLLEGASGEVQEVEHVSRLVHEREWPSDATLWMATDALLGCTFLTGCAYPGVTAWEEETGCLVIWHKTGKPSLLIGMDQFSASCTGPLPTTGGSSRAHFLTSGGHVVVPTLTVLTGTPTLLGVSGKINGVTV